jgi:tetratricopeptide (TPR) repeat protein
MARPFVMLPTTRAAPSMPGAVSGAVIPSQTGFKREEVLSPETLGAAVDVMLKSHPSAAAALSKARTGQFDGTAMLALESGDQDATAMLKGLELLSKNQLDPAAVQFSAALKNPADAAVASFYLGVCYAAAGKDREAIASWDRARTARLAIPSLPALLADAHLRLGHVTEALPLLRDAVANQPKNAALRKNLALAQSNLGQQAEAYATIEPYLSQNPSDTDALMVALRALFQIHADGKSIHTGAEDRARAEVYAKAYAAANGPNQALVGKWLEFLQSGK